MTVNDKMLAFLGCVPGDELIVVEAVCQEALGGGICWHR